MTIDERTYAKRADAGQHLKELLRQETATSSTACAARPLRAGQLGGFPLTATIDRALGQHHRHPRPRRRPRHRHPHPRTQTSQTPTRSA